MRPTVGQSTRFQSFRHGSGAVFQAALRSYHRFTVSQDHGKQIADAFERFYVAAQNVVEHLAMCAIKSLPEAAIDNAFIRHCDQFIEGAIPHWLKDQDALRNIEIRRPSIPAQSGRRETLPVVPRRRALHSHLADHLFWPSSSFALEHLTRLILVPPNAMHYDQLSNDA